MMRLKKSEKKTRKQQVRSTLTKSKILEVALEAFANKGYEGVGTREIADRAGTNLSSIRYHFGNKNGLYRAVIQHISDGLRQRISGYADQIQSRAEAPGVSKEELITMLCRLITSFASQVLASGIPDTWARLIVGEQVSPTDAFPILYDALRVLTETAALVVSRLIGEDRNAERIRISTMAILGQALVFRTHRMLSMRFIGWKSIGSRELASLQSIISDQCRAIILSQSARAPLRTKPRRGAEK